MQSVTGWKRDFKLKREILVHFPNNDAFRSVINAAMDYIQINEGKCRKYHNAYHCLLVTRNALAYATDVVPILDKTVIGLAGLFHDFGHSGKSLNIKPDIANITKAIDGLAQFRLVCNDTILRVIPWNSVESIIKSTEAVPANNHISFPNHPSSLGTYIRDADVTMLYWEDGRNTIADLAKEMGVPYDMNFKEKTVEFFTTVALYTQAANRLRAQSAATIKQWAETDALQNTKRKHTSRCA